MQFIRKNTTHLFFLSFYFAFYHFFRCVCFFYLLNKSSNSLVLFFNIETIIIFRNILSYRMWFSAKVKRLKDYELFLTAWQTSETTEMVHLFSVKHRAVYGVCLDIWKQRDNIWFLVVFIQAVSMLELEPCSHEIFAVYDIYSIQFNSIQFIDQLRALKGQQENCTCMNKQYAQ